MQLMTTQEAAQRAGLHVETIRHYIRVGHLPAHRYGRFYLVDADDLARLLANPPKPGRPRREGRA
jgi:excisionase family DNA binding protein